MSCNWVDVHSGTLYWQLAGENTNFCREECATLPLFQAQTHTNNCRLYNPRCGKPLLDVLNIKEDHFPDNVTLTVPKPVEGEKNM